jgi:exodeoxyribonuclease-1
MGETYLFYDIETSGLNRAFDQILDFAAIRTDAGLKEVERHSIKIRLRPDVVPSPAAMVVNGIRAEALCAGRYEYEAVQEIHACVNLPGTTSIGYNSIGFDDEFLRFSFHRNLLPPYTHQFANGCRRADLMPMVIMYWLYKPDVIQWPENGGKASLKLEDIGAANGLFSGRSHDALADVEAALRLARILFREKRMWGYLDGCFQKETDARRAEELPVEFIDGFGEHRLAVMVAGEFGTRARFIAPVLSLGNSIPYPKQVLWLRLDLPELQETSPDTVADKTWVVRKRHGEPGILLPPLDRYLDRMAGDRRDRMAASLDWIRSRPEVFAQIITHHRNFRYAFIPDLDADAGLYQTGFLSKPDEALRRRYHDASVAERINLAGRFASPEARTLAMRILFRNFAEELPPELADGAQRFIQSRLGNEPPVDYAGNRPTTPQSALEEIRKLREAADKPEGQDRLLDDLQQFIHRRFLANKPDFPELRPAAE